MSRTGWEVPHPYLGTCAHDARRSSPHPRVWRDEAGINRTFGQLKLTFLWCLLRNAVPCRPGKFGSFRHASETDRLEPGLPRVRHKRADRFLREASLKPRDVRKL